MVEGRNGQMLHAAPRLEVGARTPAVTCEGGNPPEFCLQISDICDSRTIRVSSPPAGRMCDLDL